MFKTPPTQRRHFGDKLRTCRALKAEQSKNTIKEDPAHEVQSEIMKPNVEKHAHPERPHSAGVILKNSIQSSKSVATKRSVNSAKSLDARKKELEFEALKAQAEIAKKEAAIEKELIQKKLAADLAALESQSAKSHRSSAKTEVDSVERVEQWLERSHLSQKQDQLDRDVCGAGSNDLRNLASAMYESNAQNKLMMSRFATSRDLPQFFGDPLEWLAYKQAYDESTNFCSFSDAENMWRLRKSLRGEAKETVSSLLIGNTAPHTIIEALELRYGRPETIINKITTQLKKLPPLSHRYHHEIVSFSIKIKNFVAAVQAIKQTDYLRSPEIVTSVLSKCPGSLINKWADYYSVNCNTEKAKLEILAEFLYCEANKIAAAGLSHIHSQPDYRKRPEERKPHSVLLGSKPVDTYKTCKFCRINKHNLPDCTRFKRAMRKDRWRFVRVNKLCHKCLLAPHSRDTCSAATCDVDECGLPHHRLLHWTPKSKETSEQSSEKINSDNLPTTSDNVLFSDNKVSSYDKKIVNSNYSVNNETVAHASSVSNTCVFLKVVPVDIQGPSGTISTYALLDGGATISLISAEIADQVNLHGHKQQLSVRGAWNSELTCDSEVVNFNIINKNNKSFSISARKMSELNLPSQNLSHIKLQNYEHLKHLDDYLLCNENITPKLLIGQDNYHLMAPLEIIIRKQNEPCATLTPLGWCVHGVCPIRCPRPKEHCMVTVATRPGPEYRRTRHHTCIAAALTDKANPLPGVQHTSACEITTDCLFTSADAIHTDLKNDELHELVKKSFTFESIGVCNKPRTNKEEIRAIDIVEKSTVIKNGQWEVGLPWKDNNAQMTDSYFNAFRRLKSIERKMAIDAEFASRYKERMNHLFANNYARKLEPHEDENLRKIWYLPHFGVDNPNKKRLRLVFDGKSISNGHSLNDYLLQGPDLLESLLGIMLRFRERPVGITGDIKDMFLRVKVRAEDQHAQRFLWRENTDEPVEKCVMTSLIFGANSSPFVAQYVKNKNAHRFITEMPEAVAAILKNHYMDDYIDCFDNIEIAQRAIKDVSYIHKQGDFEMRNWTSNEPAVCQSVPADALSEAAVNFKSDDDIYSERTLGLLWYPNTDTFGFNLSLNRIPEKILKCERKPTKRELLRIVMSIFDIYGLLTPYTIQAKIIIQSTWKSNVDWNDEIDNKQFILFKNWISKLEKIKALRIPRWYFRTQTANVNQDSASETIDLHLICDVSPAAYATIAYWRAHTDNENVCVSFIASKSRVAPIKPVSIPRLELQAAVLACRLADMIRKETRITPAKTYYWTDSMTVLHWIKNNTRSYQTFVANRLGEIDDFSHPQQWNYLPSEMNIADIATKNNNYELHNDCEWFRGPRFLYEKDAEWFKFVPGTEKQNINDEVLERIHHVCVKERNNLPVPDSARFSSWLRLLRCTANVLLFTEKCKKNSEAEINSFMLHRAEKLLLCHAQRQSFDLEMRLLTNNMQIQPDSRLRTLTPFIDECGILRVGGRVGAVMNVSPATKCPAILDGAHHISRLIVKHYHEKYAHGNNEIVVNELRQKYWILSLRPTVRTISTRCQYCSIRRAVPKAPRMADLPPARLAHHQRAFTHCGVDLFGPMEITVSRRRERRYGVLFTCMTVRCIHIELVASLTTDSFIMALRRMACRRGWPHQIYSDNGTNLRGADAELKKSFLEMDHSTIKDEMTNRGVLWTFLSPISPHKAGAWERLISVKVALKVILKERAPREETLITLLAEAENIVNSRPLTHVSVDPNDFEALTPNHFLIGSSSNLPAPGVFDEGDLYLRKMWRTAQRLSDLFWQRWVKEYLPELIPRQKWYREAQNLKKGDLVIVVDPNLPRNTWPKGIIEEVYPGKDGRVRTVALKTKAGILTRPVTRLALVPMAD